MDADVLSLEQPLAVAVPDHDAEPLLLALLAAGGTAAAWSTGADRGAWSASLAVAVLAGSAWLAQRTQRGSGPGSSSVLSTGGQRLARAVMTLAAAAVAIGANPGPAPLALAWLPAVCAVYALVLPPRPAAGVTLGALAVLTVLAAAARSGGSRPLTAYAACAVCLIAAGLAAGTLRAVRDSDAYDRTVAVEPEGRPADTPTATVVGDDDPGASAALTSSPRAGRPAGIPGTDTLLEATARAQQRSGVVGGRVGLLVVTLQGLGELPAAVGRGASQGALDVLVRRARAWLPAGDVVAWLGDGRLGVLLEGVDAQTCLVVGRRLAALLSEPVEAGQNVLALPASVSVTLADGVREAPEDLLHRALAAPALSASDLLPVAPASGGRGDTAAPDPLLEELEPALGTGGVRIALQPIVALGALPRHDRVLAVEALARWTRADGIAVPPARFVSAARRAGLADVLGATVLAQGLDALVRRRAGAQDLSLAVNVAPEQLGSPSFAPGVLRAVGSRGLDPRVLTVELPAGAPLDDAASIDTLQALRQAGVGIVLDNFGTTGLSLAALRDLPLTGIKLDRSLVADLGADDRLVVATLRLATRLGLTCTAVGVETPTQLEAARALGIDAAQGHLLGRPEADVVPASDVPERAESAPAGAQDEVLSRA